MKKLLLSSFVLAAAMGARAQYTIELETFAVHTGPFADGVNLTGYTTYRLYAVCENPTDFVSSVYGELDNPLNISTTTSFFNSNFAGLTGADVNSAILPFFPSALYDSYVTIGRSQSADPGSTINTVQSNCDSWFSEFGTNGQDLVIDCVFGGAWFALNGDVNGVAGADLKVLIGQFTTNGEFTGNVNVQIFPLGIGANEVRVIGAPFSSVGDVEGCMDDSACNYNPEATIDDNSCIFPGCTDADACNFEVNAGCDNGSCDYSCYGCTDMEACNYDMSATIDDGSCDFSCYGCTDMEACNYDADATVEDGSCFYPGCTDMEACNYNAGAGCDDGSCDFSCYGCTDMEACNYDMDATIDDESCTYPGCTDTDACNYNVDAGCDDGSCDFSCYGCTDDAACNYDMDATIDDGSCDFSCYGCTDMEACNYDMDATIEDGSCDFSCYGCTDMEACNYDADATVEDGSCIYPGCTDMEACNYDADAGCDDGSCDFSCYGCTDMEACNYDMDATIDDESCTYPGCTDMEACNYDANAGCDDGSCVFSDLALSYEVTSNNGMFDIDVTVTGGTGDYTFSWVGPNNFVSDSEDLMGVESGSYTVEVEDANSCTIAETIELIVGIEEALANIIVTVRPNPNDGQFFLNLDGMNGERIALSIYDITGRMVMGEEINGVGNVQKEINLGSASGIYFVNLLMDNYTVTKRVVVH